MSILKKQLHQLKLNQVEIEELVIVHSSEESLVNFLNNYDFESLNVVKLLWDKDPNYCEQVNYGISNAKGTWISLFEFDDEYSSIWFKNVKKYVDSYPNVQAFLPVVVETDEKGMFAGFTNEATFAANFTQEMGFLTNETLQDYQNFQTAGCVIKKSVIEDFGGFKSSIKLTFVYEFLLRLTYNSVSIMTIPKLGYKHTNMREGSIFWNYKFGEEKMLEDEVKFWVQTAKKEYFFVDDRNIKYQSEQCIMLETLSATTEDVSSKKRGRKTVNVNYFDVREEDAVRSFLLAETSEEKNKIYNEYLRGPLDKMISSIIRRYKLYRKDMDFTEIHCDTHSFLMTKVDKFKPSKEKKAYSYFGTICKNYLMGQIIKDQKEINRKVSYEDMSQSIEERPDMMYRIDEDVVDTTAIIAQYLKELRDFIETENLNDNEKKLGYALIDLFENYEAIFSSADNNKFNKNVILLSLREMTNLSTKEIRSSIKRFKKLYILIQSKMKTD